MQHDKNLKFTRAFHMFGLHLNLLNNKAEVRKTANGGLQAELYQPAAILRLLLTEW